MSKSRGNVVDPVEQLAKFGVDPVRYFLLKEGSLLKDGGTCIASVLWSYSASKMSYSC